MGMSPVRPVLGCQVRNLERRLVDIGLVDALFGDAVKDVWEKVKPITPIHSREPFEYLYNEVKKREQKLQS